MKRDKKYSEQISTFSFMKYITQEVEITYDGFNRIEMYPNLPERFMLSTEHRNILIREILQMDPQQKMRRFMGTFPLFKKTMSLYLNAYRRYPKLFEKTSTEYLIFYQQLLWVLGFIINVILILSLEVKGSFSISNLEIVGSIYYSMAQVLSFMIIVIAGIVLCIWVFLRYSIRVAEETENI